MRQRVALLGGLFGALLVALLLAPPSAERLPPLTVYSSDPTGGKALRLWLDGIGYTTTTLEDGEARLSDGVGTLLVLAPIRPVTDVQADTLEQWVRAGGRLVIVVDDRAADSLLGRFGLGVAALPTAVELAAPIRSESPDAAMRDVVVRTKSRLDVTADDVVPILGDDERVFAARARADGGDVVALSAP